MGGGRRRSRATTAAAAVAKDSIQQGGFNVMPSPTPQKDTTCHWDGGVEVAGFLLAQKRQGWGCNYHEVEDDGNDNNDNNVNCGGKRGKQGKKY
jgi:hypothetical protein